MPTSDVFRPKVQHIAWFLVYLMEVQCFLGSQLENPNRYVSSRQLAAMCIIEYGTAAKGPSKNCMWPRCKGLAVCAVCPEAHAAADLQSLGINNVAIY